MAIKNLVQIENVEADEILTRLERIEKAVLNSRPLKSIIQRNIPFHECFANFFQ